MIKETFTLNMFFTFYVESPIYIENCAPFSVETKHISTIEFNKMMFTYICAVIIHIIYIVLWVYDPLQSAKILLTIHEINI